MAPALLAPVLLGALIGLDVVSFPQIMISRPIVAATLAGAVAGDIAAGLLAGAVLELMAMETLPVGASRYPEWGTAAVVAGTLAAVRAEPRSGALVVAVFAGIATAWAGGWSMYALRRLNGIWAERMQPALEAGSWRAVVGLQLRGLTADLVRAALLTLVALVIWRPVDAWLLSRWSLDLVVSHSILVAIAAAAAASAIWRLGHGATGARWYLLGGLAAGVVFAVLQ
ncbi:MAG TPA: PTS sugar transporter subunit IIC [Gemmatimonadaceae bacterium]|jgi:PTS system mannose-specific IIC component|nr:PTS sugar transporter subunit IIC [Gemmatimonadaceae bacterium]